MDKRTPIDMQEFLNDISVPDLSGPLNLFSKDATHEQKDKDEMEMHATKHMLEAISSIKDIWRHAEPEMKERMKSDINALMNSMN